MTHATLEITQSGLTSAQSADVIRYYDASENEVSYANNWRNKVTLGRVAIHTTQPRHSILPSGEPLLTMQEMVEGLEVLEQKAVPLKQEELRWPVDPTDEQWEQIDKLNNIFDLITAYEMVMGVQAIKRKISP